MERSHYYKMQIYRWVLLFVSSSLTAIILFSLCPIFQASADRVAESVSCSSPPEQEPTSQSTLVVVLDRSGSINSTDPQEYSLSVTKALADLWPGIMDVIPFNGSTKDAKDLPVYHSSGQSDRETLKNQVQALPQPDHGTPLGPAMDEAWQLLQHSAPGSRVVLITDGAPTTTYDPTGSIQEAHVINDLLPQFCQADIQIDPFGLQTDQAASTFLGKIASGTNGSYTHIQDPVQLADSVVQLYHLWQEEHLQFQNPQTAATGGAYQFTIDKLADRVLVLVFRTDSSYAVTITYNGSTIEGSQPIPDNHYELDELDVTPPIVAGTYSVTVKNAQGQSDFGARVYVFVQSHVQVQIVAPASTVHVSEAQPIVIQARLFYSQQYPLPSPLSGGTALTATLVFTASGQQAQTSPPVTLQQQGEQNLFVSKPLIYNTPGQLQIVVHANYNGIRAVSSPYTLPVFYACTQSLVLCVWEQHQALIAIGSPSTLLLLILLLLLFVWLLRHPSPSGILRTPPLPFRQNRSQRLQDAEDDNHDIPVYLSRVGASRPLRTRIQQRSVLTSSDITNHRDARGGFDFGDASFKLIFKRDHKIDIQVISGGPIILQNGEDKISLESSESHHLETGYDIVVENQERASFSQ